MDQKLHFRHLMLFYYQKGKNARQTAQKVCAVYGKGVLAERTVQKWFARFKVGNFNLKDQERSGRPSTINNEQIKALLKENPLYTVRQLAEELNLSKSSVHEHLVKCGYVNKSLESETDSLSTFVQPKNPTGVTNASKKSPNVEKLTKTNIKNSFNLVSVSGGKQLSPAHLKSKSDMVDVTEKQIAAADLSFNIQENYKEFKPTPIKIDKT